MVTKALLKQTKQLHQKKFREERQCFIVEGEKMVGELLKSNFKIQQLFFTNDWDKPTDIPYDISFHVTDNELKEISLFETPNRVLAVVESRQQDLKPEKNGKYLVLDGIRDPGNMGTLLRIADWFGIDAIFCSNDSVEVYNPKVVQSSMGSIFRMPVVYTDLQKLFLSPCPPVYGALLNGESVYNIEITDGWMLMIGNESTGIEPKLQPYINHKISIPSFTRFETGAESLNAAVATAVICSEFCRKALK